MGWHNGLQIQLSRADHKQVGELLSGGVPPVRAVIRALVLRQMDEGRSTVEAGAAVGISAKAAWEIGKRYLEGGLERAIYDAPRPGQKPLLDAEHGQRIIAMVCGPGALARRDYGYKRCGTANVFCGVEPKAGRHFPKPTPTRSAPEFADYLLEIVARYPDARTIHLVLDNLNTHRRKALPERYGAKLGGLLWDRFTVHYTPKHGSWLNQAEIEVSLLSRQCLGQRRIPDLVTLRGEVDAWGRRANRDRTTIEWNFTRKQARRKLHYSITKTRY